MLTRTQPAISKSWLQKYSVSNLAHDIDRYRATDFLRNAIQTPVPLAEWKRK